MPSYKLNGRNLVVGDMQTTMVSRMPIPIDQLTCSCGGFRAVIALAAMSHPCPECKKHLLYQCTKCDKWLCLSCLEKVALECRKEFGLNSIAQLTILPS